jgi:DNA repair protein RadA/Sms
MQTTDLSGMAGSVGQVRECAFRLVKLAKSSGIPVFLIGHVTKEGTIAGPSVLMHIVDTVLWFEGDKTLSVRLLRAVKNRFGPTDEVGIFTMGDSGLIPENHPERLFLSEAKMKVPGSVVSAVVNGTRPILIEIQSLIVPTKLVFPRRVAQGIDAKKLELLLAVLSRRCGMPIYESDVYVTVMGGINIKNDPSVDLAICLALASAYFNKTIDRKTVVYGEVGLMGEIREVTLHEKRMKEAKRLGYNNFITSSKYDFLQKAIGEVKNN